MYDLTGTDWRLFVIAAGFSLVQLGLAWGVVALRCRVLAGKRQGESRGASIAGLVVTRVLFGVLFGVVLLVLMNWVLLLQAMILVLFALLWRLRHWRPRNYLGFGLAVTLAMFGVIGTRGVLEAEQLQRENPFESLGARLDYEVRSVVATSGEEPRLTDRSESQLANRERELTQQMTGFRPYPRRRWALQKIHASHVEQFIGSEGFGVGRTLRPSIHRVALADTGPVEQPAGDDAGESRFTADQFQNWEKHQDLEFNLLAALGQMHVESSSLFSNPVGYGYVRDRDHVAGFVAHSLGKPPGLNRPRLWELRRVELVSLLKHDPPGVYLSRHLPRMEDLKSAPVRPLDDFENFALRRLHDGEDLVVGHRTSQMKILGSLRAARQCLECHRVPRGTLLGAFSYEMVHAGPPPDPPVPLPRPST